MKGAITDDWAPGGLPDITPTSTGTAQFIDIFITTETKLFYQVRVVEP